MRRITRIATVGVASAALALSATACGGKTSSSAGSDSDGDKAAIAYDIGGRGDQSFNDAAYAGLSKAQKDLGIEGKEAEPSDGESDADKVQRLTELARAGNNPVIGVGFAYAPAIKKVAPKFPDTTFGIIDDSSVTGKNIANMVFNEEQGSYLAGVAAAKVSKSKVVGFIGGVETPLIKKFEAGYVQGVKDTDPSVNVLPQYLTQPPNFDGFSKPDLGKAAAQGQLDKKADVVYSAAGLAGSGAIEAVSKAGKWNIGVDSDQYNQEGLANYKESILTSVTKDVSDAVFNLIKSVKDGKPQTGEIRYGLDKDGVALSMSNPAFTKMTDVIAAVDKAKQEIIDGKITVKTAP
ncbi:MULTISPECIES: BMP family ABC transporter substrate-binding protein [Streptomyces]|uniref:BMP family ABC transporter substrate-binding protein n=1 Tax=Streptomyces rhizosphaericola TaxID=2564098 RepID=A0ABY2PET7_9ACTN|nr:MULTISPECIES: BMP family ABC transporter substrate-binding protein [Streptomyces]MYT91313.1 BMP family ABC transporter substrate-binding protein [Streptomyces sp. SID8359]MYT98572.1 BMP family ABC transporter substrate-binding protein [Streptomyces sp. SID8350]NGO86276.1 BMP family ABC transporter substrate-binding protein [Streptomyces sp. 196(2019)]PWS42839.1 BMP family ABC transporter substrate-binding protein [Streptomyces sp. ZEA17I]TGZ09432.1 BMP family ABC transporter substrate-bindi